MVQCAHSSRGASCRAVLASRILSRASTDLIGRLPKSLVSLFRSSSASTPCLPQPRFRTASAADTARRRLTVLHDLDQRLDGGGGMGASRLADLKRHPWPAACPLLSPTPHRQL